MLTLRSYAKRSISKYALIFLLTLNGAFAFEAKADLYEIATAEQILPFVKPDTIVFWDLDKTIMDFDVAPPHDFHLVETQIPKLIANLQANGIIVLSLTRRERSLIANTETELKRLGIDFSKNAPTLPALEFTPGMFYQNGVVYAAKQEKGNALKPFFEKTKLDPKAIILIDDQWYNIMSVLESTIKIKIPFTGFYYRQSDIQKHLFKPTAAILAVKVGDFEIEPHKSVEPKSLLQSLAVEHSSGACSDLF